MDQQGIISAKKGLHHEMNQRISGSAHQKTIEFVKQFALL